ncbi:TatD family hydrolase [Candidatus Woesearchaeota archaeon]|nr:TatD family hydrolase [Candidatus Woesearchaeota archaeon]
MIVDTHIHLDEKRYDKDRENVIDRSIASGVKKIITVGLNHKTNLKSLELAERYAIVEAALGWYPFDAADKDEQHTTTIEEEIEFIKENRKKIVAIGEIGLDKFTGKDIETQKKHFRKMVDLAIELDRPITIHSRKAEKETIEVLKESKIKPDKVIMHCFSGKKALIDQCIELGYNFSIPTNIVRAQNFQQLVEKCPIKRLLTETDGPYLSPYKNEDESFNRNEPSYIKETIKKIAEIKGITEIDCENQIFMNYQRIFS